MNLQHIESSAGMGSGHNMDSWAADTPGGQRPELNSPYTSFGMPYTPHSSGYPNMPSIPGTAPSPFTNPDTPSQIPASPYTHATPAGIPDTPGAIGGEIDKGMDRVLSLCILCELGDKDLE